MAAWCPVAGSPRSFGRDIEMASACPAGLNPGLPSPLAGWENDTASSEPRATYAPAAALLHLLRSALIMKRELSVGRWAFFNKITKAAFSPKQESKVFAAVSQHRDAFGMGGNAPTHSSHRSHSWVPRGRSGSRCFPSCSASTLCWCFSKSCETSFPACCAPGTRPEGDSSQLARLLALNLTFEELAPIFAARCLPGSSLLQG